MRHLMLLFMSIFFLLSNAQDLGLNAFERENPTVSVSYTCPQGIRVINPVRIYNENISRFVTFEDGSREAQSNNIPSGVYDIFLAFKDEYNMPIYVIKEGVQIYEDIKLEFNTEEACNDIFFDLRTPKGEVISLYQFDEKNNIIKEGNTEYIALHVHPFCLEYEKMIIRNDYYFDGYEDDNDPAKNLHIRVNNLSERYSFGIRFQILSGEDYAIIPITVTDFTSHIESNEPTKFTALDVPFSSLPIETKEGINANLFTVESGFCAWWKRRSETTMNYFIPEYEKMFIYFYPDSNLNFNMFNNFVRPFGKAFIERGRGIFYLAGAPMFLMDGKWFTPSSCDVSNGQPTFGHIEDSSYAYYFTFDSPFSFFEEDVDCIRGNSSPIAIMDQCHLEEIPGIISNWTYPSYYGRLNEFRRSDQYSLIFDIKYNGEKVAETGTDLMMFAYTFNSEEHNTGVYEYNFYNDNVLVDGISGYNLLYSKVDLGKEDNCAPTLTRLMFKNREGKITDHFTSSCDGKMIFACGDFNFNKTYYDKVERPQILVEYSPRDENNWKALDYEELDLPLEWQIGFVYTSELDQIKYKSKDGWYDLRFTLTDESENSQIQTISPAFKLEDVSGIINTELKNNEITEYYNLQGLKIMNPTPGSVVIRKNGSNINKIIF